MKLAAEPFEIEVNLTVGKDGTPVLWIDTTELEENQDGPIIRVYLNDGVVFENPEYPG